MNLKSPILKFLILLLLAVTAQAQPLLRSSLTTNAQSSLNARRITPAPGIGTNVFQVEDTNGTPFVVASSNKIFSIASEARAVDPMAGSTVFISGSNGSPLRLTLDTYNNADNFGTLLLFRRTRGTAAAPTAVLTNDVIMQLGAGGYGGTSNANSAAILAIKGAGTWTDLSRPTFFQFFTTPTNSTANSNRMEIQSFGRVDMFAGQTVKQITGLTNDIWQAQTTNGITQVVVNSNSTLNLIPRTGLANDTLDAFSTNAQTTFTINSNGMPFAQAVPGGTNDIMQFRTTNGAPIVFVRTNGTLVATNLAQTPFTPATDGTGSSEQRVAWRLGALTNSVTITNVTALTSSITNALLGSQTIPANTLQPGSTVRVTLRGKMTSASATVTTFGFRSNNGQLLGTNIIALSTSLVNDEWAMSGLLSIRSTGASGSAFFHGDVAYQTSAGGANAFATRRILNGVFATAITVDTTAGILIDPFVTPGATTHGFTTEICTIEILP